MSQSIRLCEADLRDITSSLVASCAESARINHLGCDPLPSREAIAAILGHLTDVVYPGFGSRQNLHFGNIEYYLGSLIDTLADMLATQIARALAHDLGNGKTSGDLRGEARDKTLAFLRGLPAIRRVLDLDVAAAFRGDPAAKSHHEIIFCYPGLEAITVYRLANALLKLGVPFIPRMMTEYAHGRTGIDIHPGATIGHSFFIDHGTGVVIGETCDIGTGVKLYQGVTLGALSFARDDNGELVRGNKRHPTLLDDVVVYANATILGGKTVVGERSVIGSSVWLTYTVGPDTVVVLEKPQLRVRGAVPATRDEQPMMWYI